MVLAPSAEEAIAPEVLMYGAASRGDHPLREQSVIAWSGRWKSGRPAVGCCATIGR